jgi:hypothetical protein
VEWILLVVISKLQDASTIDCVAILQRRTCSSWWERSPFIKENRGDYVSWGLSSSEYSILVLRCSLLKEEGTDKCELSNTRNLQTEQSSSQPIFQMREQYIRLDAKVNTTYNWKLMIYRASRIWKCMRLLETKQRPSMQSYHDQLSCKEKISEFKCRMFTSKGLHYDSCTQLILLLSIGAIPELPIQQDSLIFLVSLLLLNLLLFAAFWCSMYFTVHR